MSAGRSPDLAAWRRAESYLAGLPLWLGLPPVDGPRRELAVGVDDVVARLTDLVAGEVRTARAFGRPWRVVATERGLLAPGIPCLVAAANDGLDARYWRDGDAIVREAQARADTVVASEDAPDATAPAVAVWFWGTERWCLFADVLDISNHYFRAVLPATAATVGQVIVATAPALAVAIGGWPTPTTTAAATFEVGRETALLAASWDDPDHFLARRVEVEAVSGTGDRRHLRLVTGDAVEVEVCVTAPGFTLTVVAGRWLFTRLALAPDGDRAVIQVVPTTEIDLTTAATRARLAFDLTATLVAFAG